MRGCSSGQLTQEVGLKGGETGSEHGLERGFEAAARPQRGEQLAQTIGPVSIDQGADGEIALGVHDLHAVGSQPGEGLPQCL